MPRSTLMLNPRPSRTTTGARASGGIRVGATIGNGTIATTTTTAISMAMTTAMTGAAQDRDRIVLGTGNPGRGDFGVIPAGQTR